MAREAAVTLELEEERPHRIGAGRRIILLARQHPLGVFGLLCVGLFFFCGFFADVIAPYDPQAIDFQHLKEAPSLAHPFGTDRLGRDVLSRTIFGARISLLVGVVSVAVGISIGSFFGMLSGYFGKLVDSIIQRGVDILLAFPAVVLLLAIITVIGDEDSAFRKFLARDTPVPEGTFLGVPVFLDIVVIAVGIGVAVSVGTCRIVRGAVLSIKENVYIDAARAMGASDRRIMRRHIFPNIAALVVVLGTIFLPIAILAEAAISFLGIGVPDPTPSWGADLTGPNRQDATNNGIWWVVFFPGLALSLVVLGFNMLGDAFRDITDPRLRGGLGGGGSGTSRGGL